MAELRTYKDFADNSYAYFMFAYDNNQLFNEMGAMTSARKLSGYVKHTWKISSGNWHSKRCAICCAIASAAAEESTTALIF